MWIKALRTKGFGVLGNREFHFSKGLNLIYGPNEAGKTTLFDALTKALLSDPRLPRTYQGESEVLLVEGERERWVKRGILKLNATHFKNLYLVRTGELYIEEPKAFLQHFKAKLLDIDRLYKARQEIENQLGNRLSSKRKEGELLKRKGELERELQVLKEKIGLLENNPKDLLRLKELEKEERDLDQRLKEIEEKEKRFKKAWEKRNIRQELEHILSQKSKRENLERLLGEAKKLEVFTRERFLDLKELEAQKESLLKNYRSEEEALKRYEEELQERKSLLKEKEGLSKELSQKEESLALQEERLEKDLKKLAFQKRLGNLLLIGSLLALGVFLLTLKFWLIPGAGLSFGVWFFLRSKLHGREKRLKEEGESLKDQRIRNDERLKNLQKEMETLQREIDRLEGEFSQKRVLLKELEKSLKEKEEALRERLFMVGVSSLFEFEERLKAKEKLELEISLLKKEVPNSMEELEQKERELTLRLKELEDVPLEVVEEKEIEGQRQHLQGELKRCLSEINEIKGRLSEREKMIGMREEVLYMRLEEVKEELEELERKIEDYFELYKFFDELEKRLDRELMEILQGRVKEWFSHVVGERVKEFRFNERSMEVILDGMLLKERQLSASTRDSLYLSARLALIERSPYPLRTILLDDPFVTCDFQRSVKLLDVIERISENFQVIIATKDPFLKEEALKRNANVIELEVSIP